MTSPGAGADPGRSAPDTEKVLGQAMRAMAAGALVDPSVTAPGRPVGGAAPLTTAQVLLLAAIIGLVIGMSVGFAVLLGA